MSPPSSIEPLRPGDWKRLCEAAEKLEQAWRDQTDLNLVSFLPPADDPLHGSVLEELVITDLEIRRSRGQAVCLDYYLEKYPELGDARNLPARLIYEEYRVRRLLGEALDLEQYRQRFPDQFAELQRLVGEQSLRPEGETPCDPSSPLADLSTSMTLQNGNILPGGDGYRLIKRIGEGTFGEVWEVESPGGFSAAMKIIHRKLDSDEAKRELRSLEVIKRLSYPHLLKTFAAWALKDRLIILMELADCTLRDRLRECKAAGAVGIPVAELLGYFQEAAEALDYLHSQKVLHRDVKPQNLLLCQGHVKVADFDLVRDQKQPGDTDSLSGTPAYMSPEAWGCAACAASDQYSLALTYAELRLGRRPFEAGSPAFVAHLGGTPNLKGLREAERSVLLRGMAKDPKERFPTCQALVSALYDALPGDPAEHDLLAAPGPQRAPDTRPIPAYETQNLRPPGDATLDPSRDPVSERERPESGPVVHLPSPVRKPNWAVEPRRWGLWTAALLLLLVGTAVVVWLMIPPPPPPAPPGPEPSFELLNFPTERVILSAGSGKSLSVGVKRHNGFREAVRLVASNELAGLSVATTDIVPEGDSGEVRLKVAKDAAPGLGRVDVHATANGQEELATLQVVILPFGFEPIRGDPPGGNEMPYPARIVRHVGPYELVFVLIRSEGKADALFYLMENKVCNGVFRAFAEANPQAVAGGPWKQGRVAKDRNGDDDNELPVFSVTRREAQDCGEWLGGLLPTVQQLDEAFGFNRWLNAGRNPAAAKATVVNRPQRGPRKIGDGGDLSPYGIRDLAGNGREWTRDEIVSKEGKRLAVLRGRSYTALEPLSFADLDEWNNNREIRPVQYPEKRSLTTSFRVVIELPGLPRKQAAR
jgi:serine/threonine protein kinase